MQQTLYSAYIRQAPRMLSMWPSNSISHIQQDFLWNVFCTVPCNLQPADASAPCDNMLLVACINFFGVKSSGCLEVCKRQSWIQQVFQRCYGIHHYNWLDSCEEIPRVQRHQDSGGCGWWCWESPWDHHFHLSPHSWNQLWSSSCCGWCTHHAW